MGSKARESATETIPPRLRGKGEKSEARAHSACWRQQTEVNPIRCKTGGLMVVSSMI